MRTKYIQQINGDSCVIACLESFLESNGILRTQQSIIEDNGDICKKVRYGFVEINDQKVLFEREGVLFNEIGSIASTNDCPQMRDAFISLNCNESFIIGIIHQGGMHAVLFDSINFNGDCWVMDPGQGHKKLNTDYQLFNITNLNFYRISHHPLTKSIR